VRRFGSGRLGANTRGRQPRLAVIDYASVDGRRRLILVRRDNVEHLLMIGGPTDVVVEPNIVRAVAAPRDTVAARPTAGLEALPRAIPLPESASNGSWPLQPEPTAGLRPPPRIESLPDEMPARPLPPPPPPPPPAAEPVLRPLTEPAPRPQRDTLAALADELSMRPTPTRGRPAVPPRPQPTPPAEPRQESSQDAPAEPAAAPELPSPAEASVAKTAPRPPTAQPAAAPPPAPVPAPAPVVMPAAPLAPATPAAIDADKSLADMAARLEAALRKQSPAAESRQSAPPPMPRPPRPPRPSEANPVRPDAKPSQSKTTLSDSLEQEMASLLGRQTKT